jgi:hypothetical protein
MCGEVALHYAALWGAWSVTHRGTFHGIWTPSQLDKLQATQGQGAHGVLLVGSAAAALSLQLPAGALQVELFLLPVLCAVAYGYGNNRRMAPCCFPPVS